MVLLWSVIGVIVGCFSYLLQLFSRLTVEEHLGFYARLKGMSSHLVDGEVDR
jgi:ABC-type Na+ transport system ATPase subunit NatA